MAPILYHYIKEYACHNSFPLSNIHKHLFSNTMWVILKTYHTPLTTTNFDSMAHIRNYIVSNIYTRLSFIADEYSVTPSFNTVWAYTDRDETIWQGTFIHAEAKL